MSSQPSVTAKIKTALAYANFPNTELKAKIFKILDTHGGDLEDVGYTNSLQTNQLLKELDGLLGDVDESRSPDPDLKEAIKQSKEEEEG